MKKAFKAFRDRNKRSITKAVVFRAMIIVSDLIIVYAITRRIDIAVGFIFLSNIASTIIYYLHEKAWEKTNWGKIISDIKKKSIVNIILKKDREK